jgi:hypothetical protein
MSSARFTTYESSRFNASRSVADVIAGLTAGMSHQERLEQVRFIARLMDEQFTLPGTKVRFGLDSIIGLFPGLGDVITSAISLLIVHHAWQTGASPLTLARMLGNIGVDFAVGAVPVLGDLFDVAFKANRKNARLLERHLHQLTAKQGLHRSFSRMAEDAEEIPMHHDRTCRQ